MIKDGTFREDLFYRLSVISLHIPPLRKRKEDIVSLADYFLNRFNNIYNKNITEMSHEVKSVFLHHDWPGNIRELKNLIERAVIFCEEETLELDDFPEQYKKIFHDSDSQNLKDKYDTIAKEVILDALNKTDGVKQHAASLLKITRKTLYNRMKKYNLK
jgi:transcriptional regulator with PAS, ATPase and Fis domain